MQRVLPDLQDPPAPKELQAQRVPQALRALPGRLGRREQPGRLAPRVQPERVHVYAMRMACLSALWSASPIQA